MIKEFANEEFGKVRVTLKEEEPYFCLVDVARMFDISNVSEIKASIPSLDFESIEMKSGNKIVKRIFIKPQYISTVLFASKHPEADTIYEWLYRTVLPQLLKYGDYKVDDFQDPIVVVKFLEEFQNMRLRNTVLETHKKTNAPKIKYLNRLLGSETCVDLDVVPEMLKYKGIGNMELMKVLRATHIFKDCNKPCQEFCDNKCFRVVEAKSVCGNSVITSNRTFVYKKGITLIEKILSEYEVKRNAREKR
ncbi:MAG: phage antirepressor KilAC domain-containing protein [Tenericutes bacterium]|nr:phage antirepressor KilAC domain-containing protein [Mycoplasmatota bacterium]